MKHHSKLVVFIGAGFLNTGNGFTGWVIKEVVVLHIPNQLCLLWCVFHVLW